MLNTVITRPIKIAGQTVAPPSCAVLRPNTIPKQIPDKTIIANQTNSFRMINTFKGTATLPHTISSGYGALEATISA